MKKTLIKQGWNILSSILVSIVVLAAVGLVLLRMMGYQVFNVVSGSMEPTYSVGDLLYVKSVDPDAVKVGDPITFVLNENLVVATHRVIRVDAENRHFYTKGDANETADANPVHFNNLIGIPAFCVPKLGYVSDFIQHPPGTYIAVGAGLMFLVALFLPDLLREKSTKQNHTETKNEEETPV